MMLVLIASIAPFHTPKSGANPTQTGATVARTSVCSAETRLRTPEVNPQFRTRRGMRLSLTSQRHYGHGWTRIHTDKTKALLIRVNPCPSVAIGLPPCFETEED